LKQRVDKVLFIYQKVEEWHPLKQGLKQVLERPINWIKEVEEWHPLKQGLKHLADVSVDPNADSWRVTSIKTRIETSIDFWNFRFH